MVARSGASHIGSALSIADIIAVLYSNVMQFDRVNHLSPYRDRFILSKGHACTAVYAALAHTGVIPVFELENFAQNGSKLMAHISHKVPGVEFSSGSLGHGLPFATGKALAAKQQQKPWKTFVLLSDGEMQEGSNWEAMMFANHHRLNNLIAIIDNNNLQSFSTVSQTIGIEPLQKKINAFGWECIEINGHDHHQILKALTETVEGSARPKMIIAHTIKGKGVSFMENKVEWHYKSPDRNQLLQALEEVSHEG
jgi:transketolase